MSDRADEWRRALTLVSRRLGLSDLGPVRLAAALVVAGACLLALGAGAANVLGTLLWLAGVALAIPAWRRARPPG